MNELTVPESPTRTAGTVGASGPPEAPAIDPVRGVEILVDPSALELGKAVLLARSLLQFEPLLDVKLLQKVAEDGVAEGDVARVRRALDIVAELPPDARVLPLLSRLLRINDPRVRSKAALLFTRAGQNARWVREKLSEEDVRVRANIIEGLWKVDTQVAREVLLEAAGDGEHRVAANALVGLYYLDPTNATDIEGMATHNDPKFRAAAAWAMGQTEDDAFVAALQGLVKDPDSVVRTRALRSLVRIRKKAAEPAVTEPVPEEASAAPEPPPATDQDSPGPAA
jgi:HEAT repeat protein